MEIQRTEWVKFVKINEDNSGTFRQLSSPDMLLEVWGFNPGIIKNNYNNNYFETLGRVNKEGILQ